MGSTAKWYLDPLVIFGAGCFLFLVTAGTVMMVKKRRPPHKWSGSIELDAECPRCHRPLRGRLLDDFDYERPFRAWRVCFGCDFRERVMISSPWTRTQGDVIRSHQQVEADKALINDYQHQIWKLEERQRRRELARLEGLLDLSPKEFEETVATILEGHGYSEVNVCGGAGDLNVDIECLSPAGKRTAVQCKRYRDKPVGSKEVQTFIGMIHRHHRRNSAMFVTTTRYTKPAEELARRHKIELVDGEKLIALASVLSPEGGANEAAMIEGLRLKMTSVESWEQIQEERQKAASDARRARRRRRY